MEWYFDQVWVVRCLLQRGLAATYLLGFVSALCQFPALLGERGLLPAPHFLARVPFRRAPSVFHLHYSDRVFRAVAWLGITLSGLALTGISDALGIYASAATWLTLWIAYLSIVNVGQTFYGFGWESMLLEAGFFACFLGPSGMQPSLVPILALRWMLFRTELGAGLIKLRHDSCWRDLTCLYYHHETQPMPNPLSMRFHRLPRWMHRGGVVFSHFVQLVLPFGLFCPQPFAASAGTLIIAHQLMLMVSGNYAWLNWLTIVLGISAFSDATLPPFLPVDVPSMVERPPAVQVILYCLAAAVLLLSVRPVLNFFSKHQRMNHSYNRLHLVNDYGAFGSVTRERYEVVLEGASEFCSRAEPPASTEAPSDWKEYAFKGKPGDVMRRPPQVAPYHLRLDWLMWFLPLGAGHHDLWFARLVEKLLEGDPQTLRLFRENPFPDAPPRWIRARLYRYQFTSKQEHAATGAWWKRELEGDYLAPVTLPKR